MCILSRVETCRLPAVHVWREAFSESSIVGLVDLAFQRAVANVISMGFMRVKSCNA